MHKPEKLIRSIPHQTISYLCVKQRACSLDWQDLWRFPVSCNKQNRPSRLKRHFLPPSEVSYKILWLWSTLPAWAPCWCRNTPGLRDTLTSTALVPLQLHHHCSPELIQMQTPQKSLLLIQLWLIIKAHLTGLNSSPSAFFFPPVANAVRKSSYAMRK